MGTAIVTSRAVVLAQTAARRSTVRNERSWHDASERHLDSTSWGSLVRAQYRPFAERPAEAGRSFIEGQLLTSYGNRMATSVALVLKIERASTCWHWHAEASGSAER